MTFPGMIHVWRTSGEEAASAPLETVFDVLALKRLIQSRTGLSRFRQRLLHCDAALPDNLQLHAPMDIQLVALPFAEASSSQVDQLALAAENGQQAKLECLLQRPQDPDLCPDADDEHSEFPLLLAAAEGRAKCVALLLEAGANPNPVGRTMRCIGEQDIAFGKTPLAIACKRGHAAVVQLLLAAGVDRNQQGSLDLSPLHEACRLGHLDIVTMLVEAGADIDRQLDKCSGPPLLHALMAGQVQVALLLLDLGADQFVADGFGRTPMEAAAELGHAGIVRRLLKQAGAKSLTASQLALPILQAATGGNVEAFGFLLRAFLGELWQSLRVHSTYA